MINRKSCAVFLDMNGRQVGDYDLEMPWWAIQCDETQLCVNVI